MPNTKIAPPVAPKLVAGLPDRILQRLDAEDVLRNTLWAQPASDPGPWMALADIDSTLIAAKVQQRRVERAKKSLWTRPPRLRVSGHSMLFHDVHFYVLCWARIAKLARFVARKTRFRRVGLVLRRYDVDLRAMSDFRDHLEHFEERLPGGARHRSLKVPGDLFNISGDTASLGGDHVDIGRAGCHTLEAFVTELRQAVVFDSLEALAAVDHARLQSVIQRAAVSVQIERTERQVRRMLRNRLTSATEQCTPSNKALHPTPARANVSRRG